MKPPSWSAMARAMAYLQFVSIGNNLRVRLRRLKQPKYLVGAVVGGAYLFLYLGNVFRWRFQGARTPSFDRGNEVYLAGASVAMLFWVLAQWILPAKRAALQFTETELAFLLPAPLTRRALIRFKLLRAQLPILFTSAVFTLLGAGSGGEWVFRWIGWWCVLFTLELHGIASSFVLTRLLDRGLTPWPRRLAILGGVSVVAAALGFWTWRSIPGAPGSGDGFEAWREWLGTALTTGPVRAVLTPFRWVLSPWFATDWMPFLKALPAVAALLYLHYRWVLASEVSFEEASLDVARKRAEIHAAARSGRNPLTAGKRRPRRPLFRLAPTGLPAVALVWKNLIAAGSALNRRLVFVLTLWLLMVSWGISGAFARGRGFDAAAVVGGFALVAFGASLFFGPQLLRGDFRQDYESMDVLKAMPVPGWQMVAGQIFGPAFLLTVFQWASLGIVASTLGHMGIEGNLGGIADRIALLLAVALIVPGYNLLAFVIPNALVLVFPAWVQVGKEGPMGVEVMGQRLVVALGTFFVLVVGLVPSASVVAGIHLLFRWLELPLAPAWLLGGVGGLLVFLAEFAGAVVLLGKVFEKFDLSRE